MKTIKYILLAGLGILGFLVIWGLIEPYFLDKENQVAEIPNLPEAWEGKRIGLVTDFQLGMWLDNTNTVRRSIEELIEERPAVALIGGDFIYHAMENPNTEIQQAIDLVRPLTEAGIPTYAVLGNHDYGMSSQEADPKERLAKQLERKLEAIGVQVLHNEAVRLSLPGNANTSKPFYLVGVSANWPDRDRPKVALADVPDNAPRFVMMHNPNSFEAFPPQTAPVAVAGHTHGGQIRLPFTPQWSWLTFKKKDKVHVDGWIAEDYGASGNQLYVNRGIGFSVVPIRINCPPELTMFTLQSSS